ncbi:uncharacterized protein LOC142163289 [Nicotiana tabacum]|uniref:Uncharacterized protein LOC142163289 n=1 Tax=Nicotiana tabacum TaxID=4097 RepID=A0AC58RVB5_TOBAC
MAQKDRSCKFHVAEQISQEGPGSWSAQIKLQGSQDIYAYGIIFGATTDSLCEEFAKLMGSEFEMSMLGGTECLPGSSREAVHKGNVLDIVFSVGLCARLQSNSKESHLKAAKRIRRYFKGTQNLVLYYSSGDNFNLIGYADVDYAGYLVNKKSTSGMAHFLGSCFISWGTRK